MDVGEGVTVDLGENGHIVGIEILDASEKLQLSELANISIENLPLEKVVPSLCKPYKFLGACDNQKERLLLALRPNSLPAAARRYAFSVDYRSGMDFGC